MKIETIKKITIFLFLFFTSKLLALSCGQFGTFVEHNGHYYTITKDKLTFTYAKTFAEASGGYLAIPNNQDENEFLASLVLGNQFAWLGIHDPSLSNNYCYENGSCSYDTSRFKTILNTSITYSNWADGQPDNLLKTSDIGQQTTISPLGEHWVALSSVNYKWYDFGNHNDEYNNPAKFLAIYEFDAKPECFKDDDSSELVDLHCNTAVSFVDGLTADSGQLLQCETDANGVPFCPASLAACANSQNTNNGSSEEHSGDVLNSYPMSCPNGGTLKADGTCGTVCSDVAYSCPSGGTLSGTTCNKAAYNYAATCTYSCPSGGTLSGTTCNIAAYNYAATGTKNYNNGTATAITKTIYSCPSGGTLSGTTCNKAAYNYAATATAGAITYSCPLIYGCSYSLSYRYDDDYLFYSPIQEVSCRPGYATMNYVEKKTYRTKTVSMDCVATPVPTTGPTTYSCPSGGTLSGTTCKVAAVNYAATGTKITTGYTYSCPSGYSTIVSSGSSATPPANNCLKTTYSCPSGGTLSGTTCNVAAVNYAATRTCVCNPCSTQKTSSVDSTPAITLTVSPIVSGISISCSSHNYENSTCSVNTSKPITSVTLISQASKSACRLDQTFGLLNSTSMWIKDGCRGTFSLNSSSCPANYTYDTTTNTCTNKTTCPANYTYNSSAKTCQQTTYTCTGGGVLNGTNCVCPTLSGTTCGTPATSFVATADVNNKSCSYASSCPSGTSSEQTSYNATKIYSCPSGGALSGTTCIKNCQQKTYSCPSGGTLSGTTCEESFDRWITKNDAVVQLSCPTDWTTTHTRCSRLYEATESSLEIQCNYAASYIYSCPSGGTLSGTTCKVAAATATAEATTYSCPSSLLGCSYYIYYFVDDDYTYLMGSHETGYQISQGFLGETSCRPGYATMNYVEKKTYRTKTVSMDCVATPVPTTGPTTTTCYDIVPYSYYTYSCDFDVNVYGQDYMPQNTGGDSHIGSVPPSNNCVQQDYTCGSNPDQTCSSVNGVWQCSEHPCVDANDMEHTDTEVGARDGDDDGWNEQTGACNGQLYLFSGASKACRSWDLYGAFDGSNCCNDNDLLFGLISCSAEEKILAQNKKAGTCHYIGEFCSRKIRLGFIKICVQKKKSSCCFNSNLARIINEQGRPQLNKGWGSASNPECKGFTPEEFQKLDLSRIDFSEFIENIQLPNAQDLGNTIKNRVENNLNVSFPRE